MSHYFTNDTHEHDYKIITYNINNGTYTFKTDAGVFSRNDVDYGTDLLIKTVIEDTTSQNQTQKQNPTSMIDMGAGYGVISIVLSDQLKLNATAVDVNTNALELTKLNSANKKNAANKNNTNNPTNNTNNQPNPTITTTTRDNYNNTDTTADLYITNPPFRAGKQIVLEIIEDSHKRLTANGHFYMVVQKKQGMPSYKKQIEAIYHNVEVLAKSKGYYILKGSK